MIGLHTNYNKLKKTWSGPKRTLLYNPEVSLGQVLFTSLSRQSSENVLQINDEEGTTLTCGNVLSMSIRIAYNLQKLNIKPSDFVGILAYNTTNLMPLCYGLMFIGVPFHALDCELDEDACTKLWSITRPKMVFCDGDKLDFVKSVVKKLGQPINIYTLNNRSDDVKVFEDLLEDLPERMIFSPSDIVDSEQTAVIANSSGSTGLPKAVAISHKIIVETFTTS